MLAFYPDADGLLIESSDDAICHASSPSRLKSFDSPIMPVEISAFAPEGAGTSRPIRRLSATQGDFSSFHTGFGSLSAE